MNLISRYIAEVGRHLPEKDRSDIEAEVRSMIEDMIDEHSERRSQSGQPVDDRLITAVLEELGDPRLLAYKYAQPKRYLIGPEWYEGYVKVLQRVLFTALPVFALVTAILQLMENPLDFGRIFGEVIDGVFNVGTQIVFWVTLVFVLLERSGEKPEGGNKPGPQVWTVAQLPEFSGRRQISVGEAITDIFMGLLILLWVVLPLIQGWLRGAAADTPLFHPDLRTVWLPLFLVLMALNLVHDAFKLKIGRWTTALTATNVILCLSWILYILLLVTTQQVINPAFLAMLSSEQAPEPGGTTWATWTLNITALIFIGIFIWDMVNSLRLSREWKQTSRHKSIYAD